MVGASLLLLLLLGRVIDPSAARATGIAGAGGRTSASTAAGRKDEMGTKRAREEVSRSGLLLRPA